MRIRTDGKFAHRGDLVDDWRRERARIPATARDDLRRRVRREERRKDLADELGREPTDRLGERVAAVEGTVEQMNKRIDDLSTRKDSRSAILRGASRRMETYDSRTSRKIFNDSRSHNLSWQRTTRLKNYLTKYRIGSKRCWLTMKNLFSLHNIVRIGY